MVISAALAGLLVTKAPMIRADVESEFNEFVRETQTEESFFDLEELYRLLQEFFGDDDEDDDEDLEDDDGDFDDEDFDEEDFDEEDGDEEDDDPEDNENDDEDEEDDEELDDESDESEHEDMCEFTHEDDDEQDEGDDLDDEMEDETLGLDEDEDDLDDEAELDNCDFDDESDDENDENQDDEDNECENGEDCDDESSFGAPDQGFGFVNTNPVADATVFTVPIEQANDASRFLTQATLGANYPLITQVAHQGKEAWLESQLAQPPGLTMPYVEYLISPFEGEEELSEAQLDYLFEFQGVPESYFSYSWWTQAMTSPDLVRQRVATALSEIFVISRNVEEIGENPIALAGFYDMLLTHSLGNFRDLLLDVTLNPAMGVYLSHFENAKANPEAGTYPDENYAREVMQLFSIGLYELNADGTRKADSNGQPIATYNNDTIREFAKVFTGLGNGGEESSFSQVDDIGVDMYVPMRMYQQQHDTGEKRLLNGVTLPGGQDGMADINAAIDNLFNHPNVGPFIGRLLIQRLVTSNPSPAYVARVTAAFNGATGSPRGDMKALVRAILLDPEAVSAPALAADSQGKLREPMLRAVHLARAFDATSHDRTFNDNGVLLSETTNQVIFGSPSVFNFFQPGYAPLGEITNRGLVAPEFQITSASSIIGVKNYLAFATSEEGPIEIEGASSITRLDLTEEAAMTPEVLLDRLDTVLTYGTMTLGTRNAISTAIANLEGEERVRTAIYLVMISPDYTTAI